MIGPIERHERIDALDALRGFALLGVVIINMFTFMGPMDRLFTPWASAQWLQFLVLTLVQGKFYCLFSLLFGVGFAIQLARLESRGEDGPRRYRRRLVVLLLIGLAQGVFVWMGDILLPYAVIGFALLALRRRSDRALLVLAAVFIALSTGQALAEAAQRGQHVQTLTEDTAEAIRAYAAGPYSALFQVRLNQLIQGYVITFLGVGPQILAMFLCGAWAGRRGVLRDPEAHRLLLRRLAAWGLGLGLPLNGLYATLMLKGGLPMPGKVLPLLAGALFFPAAPLLAFGLAAAFVLLLPRLRMLGALAPAGRMALTHYLCHSLVFTTWFSFLVTGRYGRVAPWWAPPLALATWLVQVILSSLWLRYFRMGPFEWLWRSLTYGRLQPFRSWEA